MKTRHALSKHDKRKLRYCLKGLKIKDQTRNYNLLWVSILEVES